MDNMGAYLPMALGAGDTTLLRMTMGLRHAGQRRARDHAPPGRPRAGPQRQDRLSPRAARMPGLRRAGRQAAARRRRSSTSASRSTIRPRSTRSCNMMQGVTTRGTAAQLAALGRPIAGKTGTTNDAATTGSSARRPTSPSASMSASTSRAPWAGNMETGGGNAAPIYERIAREIFKGKPPTPFRIPPGLRMAGRPRQRPPRAATRSTRPSSPAPSPAPATVARWSDGSTGAVSGWTPPARARSRPAAPSVRAFPARARPTRTCHPAQRKPREPLHPPTCVRDMRRSLLLVASLLGRDDGWIRTFIKRTMRAEAQAMVNEIEESLVLLRRRL